jgi:Fe-Mn family superoxide dismutase
MAYQLPQLPYALDALEKSIDARTMEIHHGKHHAGYVSKLNAALENYPDLAAKGIDDLLRGIDRVPEQIRQAVINHGGGHANHTLFWQVMSAKGGGEPLGAVGKQIDKTFGGFGSFKEKFSDAAANRFGSGWAWLIVDER